MAIERMPITPEVLTWARERLGYTLDALAVKRKDFRKVAEWERGDSRPTYRQLELLAKQLSVPVAIFFFPEPPDIPDIKETFRTLSAAQFAEVPPRIRKLMHKARAFQLGLAELNDGRNPARKMVTRDLSLGVGDSVVYMAQQVRDYIGVSLSDQFKWTNPHVALKTWRKTFFDLGVSVFKDAFREIGYGGFSLYDEDFPVIYVNNSNADTRQIFTLFHELAHLLFQTSGLDKDVAFHRQFSAENYLVEATCNRLATAILVPDDAFTKEFSGCDADRSTADALARKFCVSSELIYRRFRDRGLVADSQLEAATNEWDSRPVETGGARGRNYFHTKIAYLGEEYVTLAFKRFYQDRIDEEELADYLAIKPKHIDQLEDALVEVVR